MFIITDRLTQVRIRRQTDTKGIDAVFVVQVRTFFVSSRDERSSFLERGGGRGFSLNRNTLGAVVYSLVQARKREKLMEENGGFHLVEAS